MAKEKGTDCVIDRADAGDERARLEVKELLLEPGILTAPNGLLKATETAILEQFSNTGRLSWTAEAIARRDLEVLKRDLAGPTPSPLERVVAHRLALALSEEDYIGALALKNSLTIEQRDCMERRYSRAHARAMSAAKTLAMIRRLSANVPAVAVQVNM